MQSANEPDSRLEEARLELDAIDSSADPDGHAATAMVNLSAAEKSPESARAQYVGIAMEHVLALCGSLNPSQPYYKYARNAMDALNEIQD